MNNIRQVQALNKRELEEGVSTDASWHADYRDTAYIYIGGLPFELSEGDIITIFSQFGEPTFVDLIRDKETGKSKGFAFLKYEDQRSTDLAVDNLGGAVVMGRTLRVDHTRYKKKDADLEGGSSNRTTIDSDGRVGENSHRLSDTKTLRSVDAPVLKEELELEAIMKNYDDDDPMKPFLIEEKREEIAQKLARQADKEKQRDKRRHHHHHRSRHRENNHERDDSARRASDKQSRRHTGTDMRHR